MDFSQAISNIKEKDKLLTLIEKGYLPSEINMAISKILSPFLENQTALDGLSLERFGSLSSEILCIQQDELLHSLFSTFLNTYRKAKAVNQTNCLDACSFWSKSIVNGASSYYSLVNFQVDTDGKFEEDIIRYQLHLASRIIQECIDPLLRALLHQVEIADGNNVEEAVLLDKSLGHIVDDLRKCNDIECLLVPEPWGIKLSQWRNIVAHNSYAICEGHVKCYFGENRSKEIILKKGEVSTLLNNINLLYRVLETSFVVFALDNRPMMGHLVSDDELRKDARLQQIALQVAAYGYNLISFEKNEEETRAVVLDVAAVIPEIGIFYASLLSYLFWGFTRSQRIIIEYRSRDNEPQYELSITGDELKKVELGQEKLINIKNVFDYKKISSGDGD